MYSYPEGLRFDAARGERKMILSASLF